ncbi:MAG TPA: hypothetical protein VKU61_13415 [Candidatus Binatia bacterium]|nr:hypothetical protein [Candidatus Binatia bacterium]
MRSGLYAQPQLPGPDTPVGQVLAERRGSLIADLGGVEACSTAQLCLVDLVVASWAQLDSVTAYLLTLPSLVDRRHRRVWQVVRDRETLAARLQSLLRDLGLERRARDVRLDVVTALAEAASRPMKGEVNFHPFDLAADPGGRLPPNGSVGPNGASEQE